MLFEGKRFSKILGHRSHFYCVERIYYLRAAFANDPASILEMVASWRYENFSEAEATKAAQQKQQFKSDERKIDNLIDLEKTKASWQFQVMSRRII